MGDLTSSLAELLRLAQWGPRQLVLAINARLVAQDRERLRLDPTAGYSWVGKGFMPRAPVPGIAAAVLSERLGYPVTVADLWPGRAPPGGPALCAVAGLDTLTSIDDLVRELGILGVQAVTPLCPVTEASGADLAAAVLDRSRAVLAVSWERAGRDRVLPGQVDLIGEHVAALRRLDDRHGGGALSVRYVTAELRSVIDLVEHASYEPKVGARLLTIVADLAQLLGWLSFDSACPGAAERYLLLSLATCRAVGAADRAANVIGMLSYVSSFAGHGSQAVHLAEAAHRECARPDPVLRARLLGREATAAAADGDLARFRRQSEHAAELLDHHAASRHAPSFLYYLTPEQFAAEAGQGLVALAEQATAYRARLLGEAIGVLDGAVAVMAAPGPAEASPSYPRSAMLHGTFLVRACLLNGELERAVAVTRTVLGLLGQVQSPRARSYLHGLRPALARRSRSAAVRDLLEEFDQASSRV